MSHHWMYQYFHKRWTPEYDCWAHFVEVQREEFGIHSFDNLMGIPKVLDYVGALNYVKNNAVFKRHWQPVEKPKNGDAIVFGGGRLKFHIGTYLDCDTGGVLHCCESQGVTFTRWRAFVQMESDEEFILRHAA